MPRRLKHVAKRPAKDPFDYVIYFFTVATPLFELPQAYTIFSTHSAGSVSIWTWGFFLIDNVVWLIYGFRRNLKPLVLTSILYLIIELIVVVGILKYS
jgi:uncharacterized protein with PQ loop repeat